MTTNSELAGGQCRVKGFHRLRDYAVSIYWKKLKAMICHINAWTFTDFVVYFINAANPCGSSPCKNGGVCTNSGSSYTCSCPSLWTGPDCSTRKKVVLLNGFKLLTCFWGRDALSYFFIHSKSVQQYEFVVSCSIELKSVQLEKSRRLTLSGAYLLSSSPQINSLQY
jgi:hypothetical protein